MNPEGKLDVAKLYEFVKDDPGYSVTINNHLDDYGFPAGPPTVTVKLNGEVVEQHDITGTWKVP